MPEEYGRTNHPARPEQRDSFEKGLDHKPDPPEEDLDPDFAEPVGEFAGPTEPDAPVGEFAGGPVPRGSHTGAFAGGEQRAGASPTPTASCSPAIRTAWSGCASLATVASHGS